MRQSNAKADIVIAGAGIPGLTLALALAKALKPNFSVVVCDPSLAKPPAEDHRVSAITQSARRMLDALGIWAKVAGDAQPVNAMEITDSKLDDVVRPSFLHFQDEREGGDGPLAHIVPHRALAAALREAAAAEAVELRAQPVEGFQTGEESVAVNLSGDQSLATKLLVAADGARSKLRARAKIPSVATDYKQMGIVATIGHEREHEGIATQHFLPAGTFATLPLTGKRSSIVWAEEADEARRIAALSPEEFKLELVKRFGRKLGEIEALSPVRAYPLTLSIARTFIGERLALLGDAAHVVHPLAGQGLNLGLRDAAALAESIVDAVRLGLDAGGPEVLKRYERWRRFDTVAMAGMTDGLNRLFSNHSDTLRVMRDVGLGIVERAPKLKEFFVGEAAGDKGETPKLMRGEIL
jgi:2-octaprenyl-6-methoxyphenol hydroxylase